MTDKQSSSLLKWSQRIGALAVVAHFFGFAYLKGTIKGVGLGDYSITIGLHDGLFLSAKAIAEIFSNIRGWDGYLKLVSEMFSPKQLIVYAGASFLAGVVVKIFDKGSKKDGEEKEAGIIDRFRDRSNRILQSWVGPFVLAFIGPALYFVIQHLAIAIFVMMLAMIVVFLSVGYVIGASQGEELIQNHVCVPLEREVDSDLTVPSCTRYIDFKGEEHVGKLLYGSSSETIFITNDAALVFDSDRKIVGYSMFQRP